MEQFVSRWIVEISPGRYAMVDDVDELSDWDGDVLEISLPVTVAFMYDSIMHAWYNIQAFMNIQWMTMQAKLEEDGGELEIEEPDKSSTEYVADEKASDYTKQFENIINLNGMQSLGQRRSRDEKDE
jgi:hypothetical protein